MKYEDDLFHKMEDLGVRFNERRDIDGFLWILSDDKITNLEC